MRVHRAWLTLPLAVLVGAPLLSIAGNRRSGKMMETPVTVVSTGPASRQQVEDLARISLSGMEQRLGMRLRTTKLQLKVCPSEAAYEKAGGLGNTDACFIAPSTILLRGTQVDPSDLSHEFAHAIIEEVTDAECPVWLEEGIINHENHVTPYGQYTREELSGLGETMQALSHASRRWSLQSLSDATQDTGIMDDGFYAASWAASDYVYRTYGRETVMRVVRRMARDGVDQAFEAETGKTLDEIEHDWRASLTRAIQ